MENFYHTLFTVEITLLSIVAAAVFVFVRILYNRFSHYEASAILKNNWLITYFVISFFTLLYTATGLLITSFPNSNPIPFIEKSWLFIFENSWSGLGIVFFFIVSVGLLIKITLETSEYMNPDNAVPISADAMKYDLLKDFLLNQYGVPKPMQSILIYIEHQEGEKERLSEEDEDYDIEEDIKRQKEIINKVKNSQDPLKPLDRFIMTAIRDQDVSMLRAGCRELQSISIKFINSQKVKFSKKWNPNSQLVNNYLDYFVDNISLYLDWCDDKNFVIGKIELLKLTKKILDKSLLQRNKPLEIKKILTLWKLTGKNLIGIQPKVLNQVINFYKDIIDYAFEEGIKDRKDWLEESFRNIDVLAENLFEQEGIEESTMIFDYHYTTTQDLLLNSLFSIGDKYNDDYSNEYPLVYFDVVEVICIKLMSIYKESSRADLKDVLFQCLYVYSSFAEKAIESGNSKGASLAISKLKKIYKKVKEENVDYVAKHSIERITSIGCLCATNRDKLEEVDFIGPLEEFVIDILKDSSYQKSISKSVNESHRKMLGIGSKNGEDLWDFITTLGNELKTNFGFMFDWRTGETYDDDDPRRY